MPLFSIIGSLIYMSNFLNGLKIDYWYKAVLVVAVGFLALSLTIEFKGVENGHVALISLGCALIGLGEWINHPLQQAIMAPSLDYPGWGKLSGYPRRNTLLGNLLLIGGIALGGLGVYRLVGL